MRGFVERLSLGTTTIIYGVGNTGDSITPEMVKRYIRDRRVLTCNPYEVS